MDVAPQAPTPRALALRWVIAIVSYVVLGLLFKSLVLNWIVGPLYPLLVVYLIPEWFARRRATHR